jgi:hypothetical protein
MLTSKLTYTSHLDNADTNQSSDIEFSMDICVTDQGERTFVMVATTSNAGTRTLTVNDDGPTGESAVDGAIVALFRLFRETLDHGSPTPQLGN